MHEGLEVGLGALLGIDNGQHLKIQPARKAGAPVRQQRLRGGIGPLLGAVCGPVAGSDDVLADEQLAVRCHGRRELAKDLAGLGVGPVVDDVAQKVDVGAFGLIFLKEVLLLEACPARVGYGCVVCAEELRVWDDVSYRAANIDNISHLEELFPVLGEVLDLQLQVMERADDGQGCATDTAPDID